MTSDKLYFPHLTRTVYKIASELADVDGTCTIRQIAERILQDAKLDRQCLEKRIRTAIKSLAITEDVSIQKSKGERNHIITIKIKT